MAHADNEPEFSNHAEAVMDVVSLLIREANASKPEELGAAKAQEQSSEALRQAKVEIAEKAVAADQKDHQPPAYSPAQQGSAVDFNGISVHSSGFFAGDKETSALRRVSDDPLGITLAMIQSINRRRDAQKIFSKMKDLVVVYIKGSNNESEQRAILQAVHQSGTALNSFFSKQTGSRRVDENRGRLKQLLTLKAQLDGRDVGSNGGAGACEPNARQACLVS